MARLSADVHLMLAEFEAKEQVVEVGEVFNLTEFASILGMSVTNFRKTYLDGDPTFPFLKVGHGGTDYEIDGRVALKHLADKMRSRIVEQDSRASRLAMLAGIKASINAQDRLTIEEAQKVERIQDSQFKRRLASGDLVDAKIHRRIVSDLCIRAGDRFGSVATELDASGLWPKEVREQVVEWSRKQRIMLHEDYKEYLIGDEQDTGGNRG